MKMYPFSISPGKHVPFIILIDEHVPLQFLMTKYFVMIIHGYI